MKVYVVRHGIAEDGGLDLPDEARRLTEEGRDELGRSVAGLEALGVRLDRLFSSPLVRARETAEILREGLRGPVPELVPELEPGGEPEALLRALRGAGERVAVVGHEPGLGHLVSASLFGRVTDATPLKKGAVVCLRFASPGPRPGTATLAWAMTPRQLRHLR